MTENASTNSHEITLYRKYRPQTLGDVFGQHHVLTVLKNALKEGRVAHAYLFAGPRGTGKTTIARILAKRLNCLNPKESEPCGDCVHCQAFAAKASLDLIEIDAASNRGIDEIRALKDRISLAPTSGKYKIYIIDEVHMLTKEAFNALLKTLEEPPAHAKFILATTELHKVPDTIKSRCQTFLFRRASVKLLLERMQKIASAEGAQIDEKALLLIANHSEGCFRDAESLLGQVLATQGSNISVADVEVMLGVIGFEQIQDFISRLLNKDTRAAIDTIQKLTDRGASLRRFADDVTRYLRAVASMSAAGVHSESFDPVVEERLQEQVKKNNTDTFIKLLRLFLRAKSEMRDATYEELPLELVIIEWCEGANKTTPPQAPPTANQAASVANKPTMPSQDTPKVAEISARPKLVLNKQEPRGDEMMADNPQMLEKVVNAWREFMERTAALNPLLVSTLEACRPCAVRGNALYLLTEYTLYKERITDNRVREPLEKLLEEIIGEKALIRVAHKSEAASLRLPQPTEIPVEPQTTAQNSNSQPNTVDATADALAVLGGELVNG